MNILTLIIFMNALNTVPGENKVFDKVAQIKPEINKTIFKKKYFPKSLKSFIKPKKTSKDF